MMRLKLSPAQQEVVAHLHDGWELGVREGLEARCWLQKGRVGHGGESKQVGIGTFRALMARGVVKARAVGHPVTTYALAAGYGESRSLRQGRMFDWCLAAFGSVEAQSLELRGLRHAEEAVELAQACGCDRETLHKLIDAIYAKPAGDIAQELGGSGVTLLALASAAGLDADSTESAELDRVLSKPLEYFTARNDAKNAAGFGLRTCGEVT